MNPLTNVRNVSKLNDQDLRNGIFDHTKTWHSQYKDSAYIFVGGLPYDLTEGDVLCVFSQYGEIVNINLVRDKKSGKFKGYGFICYEDQRSTTLAVDNFNAIKLGGRTIRVDHVSEYRIPKGDEKDEDGKFKNKIEEGCAPKTPSPDPSEAEDENEHKSQKKKKKKEKKKKKKKSKKSEENLSDEEKDAKYHKERNTEQTKQHDRPSHDKDFHQKGVNIKSDHQHRHHNESTSPYKKYHRDRNRSRSPKRKRHDSPSPKKSSERNRSMSPKRRRSRSPRDRH